MAQSHAIENAVDTILSFLLIQLNVLTTVQLAWIYDHPTFNSYFL